MENNVRVRFAPSPTGGLHLGGVRTVLYNYLFAKKNQGTFVLRIEDTDQSRYVEGAEQYIINCLEWCGLVPDESPYHPGPYSPYRQSERKEMYRAFAEQLVKAGYAYYAFDTPGELEQMRNQFKTESNPSPQYNHVIRTKMKNSLSLSSAEVDELLKKNTPHVIRIKMPENEDVSFEDIIRGTVQFNSGLVDDKVLLKADGMPTYHLAVVVDDYSMKITHAFRGEEWLPSAPVHILLWRYLGWEKDMPKWAHLPLILKPDGNGKLSKRDGDRLGFPVFAMDWTDPKTGETTKGFREIGFLPQAFTNMLALLGWNDGSGQEIYTLEELTDRFSLERVHKAGAKFDFEKAKWFNHEWIKRLPAKELVSYVKPILEEKGLQVNNIEFLEKVIELVKDRCSLLTEFYQHASFFFKAPVEPELDTVKPKWNDAKQRFFQQVIDQLKSSYGKSSLELENAFKELAASANIKPGELLLPLRIMLVGGKFGPGVFDIISLIGTEEASNRIQYSLSKLSS